MTIDTPSLSHQLSNTPLFAELSHNELEQLIENTSVVTYSTGQLIIREYDKADAMFVILSGEVAIFITTNDGHLVTLDQLTSNQYFGEQAILPGNPSRRTANAKAVTEVEVLKISKATFLATFEKKDHLLTSLSNVKENQLRHRLLQESSLFREIPLGNDIHQCLTEQSFAPDETIFKENDPAKDFYFTLWGTAEVAKQAKDSETQELLAYIGPGRCFGDIALIDNELRIATVRAKTELLTLVLDGEQFMALYSNSALLQKRLARLHSTYQLPI